MTAISTRSRGFQRTWLLTIAILGGASPALAQAEYFSPSSCGVTPSFKQVFTGTLRDFRQLRSGSTLGMAAFGGIAAFGAHSVDGSVTRSISDPNPLRETFKTGALIEHAEAITNDRNPWVVARETFADMGQNHFAQTDRFVDLADRAEKSREILRSGECRA